MRRPKSILTVIGEAVHAADPGLLRLRAGAITAFSVSLAVLVLGTVATAQGKPVADELLGVVLAMVSAPLVREPRRRDRLITSALLPVAACATVTAAALLARNPAASTGVFVLVMFLAAYIRRFDVRGAAVGMVAFIGYFYTLFLHAGAEQLPTLLSSAVIGTCCSLVAREFVLPERDTAVLGRLLPSVRARAGAVLDATRAAIEDGTLTERGDRRLRVRMRRLNETTLLVEDRVERAGEDRLWPKLSNEALALRVFDLELATEEVALATARLLSRPVPERDRRLLVRLIRLLRRSLRDDTGIGRDALAAAERLAETAHNEATAPLVKGMQMMIRAISGLRPEAAPEFPVPPDTDDRQSDSGRAPAEQAGSNDEETAEDEDNKPRLLPSTRQAVQTAVAGGLAIAVGHLIAPDRWYWAALTAFVVFIGTSSRGETLSRSTQRLIGTLAGVLAGVLVAAPLSGDPRLSLVLIVVFVFLAFYVQRVNHGLFTFFLTVVLALLYGIIGQFSVQVLALRLEETAIGAVCGIVASYLVLPISTRETMRQKLTDFADQLSELIDEAVDVLCGKRPGSNLIAEARELDTATTALRLAARPLSHGVAGVGGRRRVRGWIRAVRACDQYARELAQVSHPLGWLVPAPPVLREQTEAREALRAGRDRMLAHLELLPDALDDPIADKPESAVPLLDQVTARADAQEDEVVRRAVHYLIRIEQTVLAALGHRASERLVQARTPRNGSASR